MAERTRVGLIGAGLMGHGIGKNILEKGFPLAVMAHRNRAPVEDLIGRGARELADARAIAAECDVVITCVTGSPQLESQVFGAAGLLAGAHAGLTMVDCTTADPNSTARIAAAIEAAGARFVDAPLTRTPKEAEAGKLAVMAGGDTADLERIRPILDCFADTIVHAGGIGAGHKLKLVNNFLALGVAALVAEGLCAAKKADIDMKALEAVVTSGGANSVMFQRLMRLVIDDDDSAAQFAIGNAEKDLRYYTDMTRAMPVTSPLGEAVHQSYLLACAMGRREQFVPRMVDLIGEINRVRIRAGG
jgi:3-hydroxyisobutyrate dehydrogenase-like beta-hydroxyacid dehydrogenase